jgi:hypothetical protein
LNISPPVDVPSLSAGRFRQVLKMTIFVYFGVLLLSAFGRQNSLNTDQWCF